MEYLFEIALIVVAVLVSGVIAWGISVVKERWDLDPDGQIMRSLEAFEVHAVDWIVAKAAEAGEDLTIPETRNKYINMALEWAVPKVPKLMDFLGYSKDDLRQDLDALLQEYLDRLHEKLT